MKAAGSSIPFIVLVSGFIAMVGLVRLRQAPPQAERIEKTALVDVAEVEACGDGFYLHVDGEVIPYRETNMSAQIGGRIAKKSDLARAGHYVREGDLLFEIDPRDYELEVRRLQESVKQAGSSIEELDVQQANVQTLVKLAEEQLALQRAEFGRFEDLRKKNAASASQLEKVRQAELQSLNSLQSLKNQVSLLTTQRNRLLQQKQSAITGLDIATLNLERTKIRSPLNGVVIQDYAEQDDFVQPGSKLIQLEDRTKVEVRFSLRMDQLRWLWNSGEKIAKSSDATITVPEYTYELPKIPIQVRVESDGNHFTWPARLDRYDGAGIDPKTRTIPLIAVVDDPTDVRLQKEDKAVPLGTPPTLLRGSYVSVDLLVGKNMPLVSIPAHAYRPNKTVWIYRDGVLAIQPVKIAYSDEDVAIVLADSQLLKAGDLVITSPLTVAEESMKLQRSGT